MRQMFEPSKSNSHPVAELSLTVLVALAALVFTAITGFADPVLRPLMQTYPLHGGVLLFFIVLGVGIVLFAIRRWWEAAQAYAASHQIFERSIEGIFQSTLDGRYLSMNPAHAKMFGYSSPEEMIATIHDITRQIYVHPAQRAKFTQSLLEKGEVRNFENQVYRKDGSIMWVLITARAERAADGTLLYFEGNIQDITASKQAELLYRNLVDHSLEGIAIFQEGRFVFANRAVSELLGYSVAELLAMTPEQALNIVHPNDRAQVATRMRERIAGKNIPARSIFQVIRQDGATRWMETSASLIDYHGAPAILLLMNDVTERKRAQDGMQANLLRAGMRQDLNAVLARAGMDLDAVLNSVVRIVSASLGDLCAVGLVSADGAWVEPKAYSHIQRERQARLDALFKQTRLPVNHPYLGRVITAGEPLFIPQFGPDASAKLATSEYLEYIREFGLGSYLVLPIRHQGRQVLGALVLLRERGGAPYAVQDQILLQEFADRSALAIANAQLVKQLRTELEARRRAELALRQSLEQVEALHKTALDIASHSELPALLDSICERAARLLNAPTSRIYLCEPDAQRVRVVAAYNTPGDFRGIALNYGEGAAGRVVVTGKPLCIPNYQTWEGRAGVYAARDFFSVLTVPMFWQGQVIGALAVDDGAERAFTDNDVQLLAIFAEQAASVVVAAQFQARAATTRTNNVAPHARAANAARADIERRAQEVFAEALRDATALLNRVTEYEQVLEGILETLERIVPYETACVFLRQADRLQVVRARGFEAYGLGEWIKTFALPLDAPNFKMLTQSDEPLLIRDSAEWEGWVPVHETQWARSHIAAPIRLNHQTEGMITLDHRAVGFYREEDGVRVAAFADLAAAALNNAELLRQAERRAQQLSLLYDAGLTLNRVLDAKTQLQFLFQIARRSIRAERMAFFRYAPAEDKLIFEVGIGIPPEVQTALVAQPLSVARAEGLAGWAAQQRLPALVPDVSTDARWLNVEDQVQSAIAVPVEHENALRGVLLASSHTRAAFNAQDERMLILLANQVAAAMELTRLFEAQAHRQHELEILREANLLFTTTFERAVLITQILDYALRLVHADNAHLYLYEDNRLALGGVKWLNPPFFESPQEPRQDGLTYTAARSGQMIVVDEVNSHPLFANWQWGGAIVALPLRSGDQVRAVLNVAYEKPHHFEPEELRALQLLVDQAAIALENARNFAETQRQLRDAQLLHRAGEALTHAFTLDEMLERLADFFMEAVHVDSCCISMLDASREHLVVMLDRDITPKTRVAAGTLYAIAELPYLRSFLAGQRTMILQRDVPNLASDIAFNMDSFNWKSVLMVPLRAGHEVIGLVELSEQRVRREFFPAEVRLAESLSHQAAGVLQNARLLEQMERYAQALTLLQRLAQRVNGARTLEELGAVMEQETLSLLPADLFVFALYDDAHKRVFFQRLVESGRRLASFEGQLEPGFLQQLIHTKRVLRWDDQSPAEAPKEIPMQIFGSGERYRSALGAPLRLGERVVGILALWHLRPHAYGAENESLLQSIADQIAVAVERVREAQSAPAL
jgi:PAS domain S-box-containing protein